MDTRVIRLILVVVIAFIVAIWLGIALVTNQTETIIQVIAVASFAICLALGRRIWLLVPFFGALGLRFSIPGSPDSELFGYIPFLAFSGALIMIRKLPLNFHRTELGFWTLLISLMVLQVYARHPAGLNLFGATNIGGKPYVLFVITLSVSVMLSGLVVPPKELKQAMYLSIFGYFCNLGLGLVGKLFPSLGQWYGAIDMEADSRTGEYQQAEIVDPSRAGRDQTMSYLAQNLSLIISTFKSPLRACFHPLWAPLVLIAFVAGGMSGFRNSIATVGLTFLVGILYRGGIPSVIVSFLGGATALAAVSIINAIHPLPPNLQRAFSFLPGTWEERYIADAESSSEWRFEMWTEALTSKQYIRNKILGDGLGMTADELRRSKDLALMKAEGSGVFDIQRENIMINGDYHSGPVQTIKTVGYVGLVILLLAMIRLAVHAHRQIMRTRGTEWYPVALFFGIPLIWNPIFFTFIFGSFIYGAGSFLLGAGMIRLLANNLPLPPYQNRRSRHAMPYPIKLSEKQTASPV